MSRDDKQVELLDTYFGALVSGAQSSPPPNLDPDDAQLLSRLVRSISAPRPEPAFVRQLRDQIGLAAKSSYSVRPSATVIGPTTSVSSWTYSAQRDDIVVTISAMASDKDPQLGSTQVSIRVESLQQGLEAAGWRLNPPPKEKP